MEPGHHGGLRVGRSLRVPENQPEPTHARRSGRYQGHGVGARETTHVSAHPGRLCPAVSVAAVSRRKTATMVTTTTFYGYRGVTVMTCPLDGVLGTG